MKEKQAIIVTDLGLGDAGKGTTIDFLSRDKNAHTVIRFNGGAQAAHNVITPDGKHHTFAQFGSGTFVKGVKTHLSRFMMVNPINIFNENQHLVSLGILDALDRLTIDERALVTTPFHQASNRLQELARDANRHGSCGMGIGETMSDYLNYGEDVLFMGDLKDAALTLKKLTFLRDLKISKLHEIKSLLPNNDLAKKEVDLLENSFALDNLADLYQKQIFSLKITDEHFSRQLINQPGTLLFEGAQGVLLDQKYGFHPYNSWSNTTFENALSLLSESNYDGQITKLGVIRAYSTRHGAGPFITEDKDLTTLIPDYHNGTGIWQQGFRVGYLDLVATKYSLAATCGVDYLAVTNLDRIKDFPHLLVCTKYQSGNINVKDLELNQSADQIQKYAPIYQEITDKNPETLLDVIESELKTPVCLTSYGPTAIDKKWR